MINYFKLLYNAHRGLKSAPRRERVAIILCMAIMHSLRPKDLILSFEKKGGKSMVQIIE